MSEATVGDVARVVNGFSLRGIPRGMYCRALDVREYMGWSRETWQLWCAAGLKTDYPGTAAEHVDTDVLIDFLKQCPRDLGPRPSAARRAATAARKQAKKGV